MYEYIRNNSVLRSNFELSHLFPINPLNATSAVTYYQMPHIDPPHHPPLKHITLTFPFRFSLLFGDLC